MTIRSALTLIVVLSSTAVAAQPDPSFNGTFRNFKCDGKSIVMCEGEFCRQLYGPLSFGEAGSMIIDLVNRTYISSSDGIKSSFEIAEVSKAELNKPLWSKIRVMVSDRKANMMITSSPRQGGGYSTTAAIKMMADDDKFITVISMSCSG